MNNYPSLPLYTFTERRLSAWKILWENLWNSEVPKRQCHLPFWWIHTVGQKRVSFIVRCPYISEVEMYAGVVLNIRILEARKSVLFREVSSIQEYHALWLFVLCVCTSLYIHFSLLLLPVLEVIKATIPSVLQFRVSGLQSACNIQYVCYEGGVCAMSRLWFGRCVPLGVLLY